jgi:hypothetical protein
MTVPEGYRQKIADAVAEYFKGKEITIYPPRRISPGSMKVLMTWVMSTEKTYLEEEGPQLNEFFAELRFPYRIEQNPERL